MTEEAGYDVASNHRRLRNHSIPQRLQPVLVGGWSSSSRSVNPAGNPIIHSTNRGWSDPAAPRLTASGDDSPFFVSRGVVLPPLSPSTARGVGRSPVQAIPDNFGSPRLFHFPFARSMQSSATGVGSKPSHKASVSVVPEFAFFASGDRFAVAFRDPFASVAVGVGKRPVLASVSREAFPRPL